MYKKYRAVFEALASQNTSMEVQSQFNLMAIFWICSLFLQHTSPNEGNAIEVTDILYSIFRLLFTEIVCQLPESHVALKFGKEFSEYEIPSEEEYQSYRGRIVERLQMVCDWRYGGSTVLNLEMLATNENFMQRYLDDIANQYDKFKLTLHKHTVDAISFLELQKVIFIISRL